MKKRLVSLLLVAATLVMLFAPAALANETWYVYTANGKTLNVREKPNGSILGRVNYGSAVDVVVYDPTGWSLIWYQIPGTEFQGEAYVNSRFLVKYPPAPFVPTPVTAVPGPVVTPVPGGSTGTNMSVLNAEFKTAKKVATPYTVVCRPNRASGWVNLRWAPNTEAERIATCPQGKVLVVMAELKSWYQVQDPDTGMVGFIMKKYTSIQ